MRYILYTVGTKGDNFYLGKSFAEQEAQRREAIGDTDFELQTLEYLPSYAGKSNVIQFMHKEPDNKHFEVICYAIEDNNCYYCIVLNGRQYNINNLKWRMHFNKLDIVKKWMLGFKQMYPKLQMSKGNSDLCEDKNTIPTEDIYRLRQEAREWIKFILEIEGFETLEAGIEKRVLKQPFASLVRLAYAEECYLAGKIEEGDKYLHRVDLTLASSSNLNLDQEFKDVLQIRNEKVGEKGKGICLARFK